MILTRVHYTVKLRSEWNDLFFFFKPMWDNKGVSVSRGTLWKNSWISSCLLYWRIKHPLLIVVQTLTAVLWNAAGTAWGLGDEVTDSGACHICLRLGLLQHVQFGMKASTSSCTTNRAGWHGCVTPVCCALWWLTVHLPGHVKELTIAQSTEGWRTVCLWGHLLMYSYHV